MNSIIWNPPYVEVEVITSVNTKIKIWLIYDNVGDEIKVLKKETEEIIVKEKKVEETKVGKVLSNNEVDDIEIIVE